MARLLNSFYTRPVSTFPGAIRHSRARWRLAGQTGRERGRVATEKRGQIVCLGSGRRARLGDVQSAGPRESLAQDISAV
jgi:hypothetical protein